MQWNQTYGGTGTDDGRSLIQSVDEDTHWLETQIVWAGGNDILFGEDRRGWRGCWG